MRQCISLLLAVSFFLALCGCGSSDIVTPVNFYYCTDPVDYNTPEGVVSAEIRDADGYGKDFQALLNLYVKGPNSDGFRTPFPAGTNVVSIVITDLTAEICLNDVFASLSGHKLTIACVCMSKTVMDLTGCTSVRIQSESLQLDGNPYIEMTSQDFIFLDEYISETQS